MNGDPRSVVQLKALSWMAAATAILAGQAGFDQRGRLAVPLWERHIFQIGTGDCWLTQRRTTC